MSGSQLTRIVLVRHGQTDYNRDGQVQGAVDIPLNEVGRAQAQQMGPQVAKFQPSLIVTSDLGRAVETAEAIASHCAAKMRVHAGLRERGFGLFEGATRQQMEAEYPQWYQQWRETGECEAAGIEKRSVVGNRFAAAVEELAVRGGTTVFVSHGSATTQGMCSLLELDAGVWMGLKGLNNCHWSVLEESDRHPRWRLLAHNLGVSSLDEGRSMA
ncbi:MAG: histidine phosphatase family protein [Actinomycetaceae bacterium]|nr:histidine phosphatase family protein [Actinomycetaceae bacterium]